LEGPPRQPVVRLRASFPDGVLLVPRAPDIRYDGLFPIDTRCFIDQTGDTASPTRCRLVSTYFPGRHLSGQIFEIECRGSQFPTSSTLL
jgi:hypothetical protein